MRKFYGKKYFSFILIVILFYFIWRHGSNDDVDVFDRDGYYKQDFNKRKNRIIKILRSGNIQTVITKG